MIDHNGLLLPSPNLCQPLLQAFSAHVHTNIDAHTVVARLTRQLPSQQTYKDVYIQQTE